MAQSTAETPEKVIPMEQLLLQTTPSHLIAVTAAIIVWNISRAWATSHFSRKAKLDERLVEALERIVARLDKIDTHLENS